MENKRELEAGVVSVGVSLRLTPTKISDAGKRRKYCKMQESHGGAVERARLLCLISFGVFVIAILIDLSLGRPVQVA